MKTYKEVLAELSAEDAKAITDEFSRKNEENQGLRTRATDAEGLVTKMKTHFKVDTIDDAFMQKLTDERTKGMTDSEKLVEIQQALDAEKQARSKLQGDMAGLELRGREKTRDDAILAGLGKLKIRNEAMASTVQLVAMRSIFDEGAGAWRYEGKNLDEYLEGFVKDHSYLVSNSAKGGATDQSQNNGGGGGGEAGPKFTAEEVDAMTDEVRKANHKEIVESMKYWN